MQDRSDEQKENKAGFFFKGFKKYDRQLIVSLIKNSPVAYILSKKGEEKGLSTTVLLWGEEKDSSHIFSQLTQHSRIYLDGHCGPGEPAVHRKRRGQKGDVILSFENVVDVLVEKAPQLQALTAEKRITICVVGCHSAKDDLERHQKSFCSLLSRKLKEKGIHAIVHGYNGSVRAGMLGKEEGYKSCKLVDDEHQPPHYKSFFIDGEKRDSKPLNFFSAINASSVSAVKTVQNLINKVFG